MAQTGYTPISIYYSSTATNVPTAGNLVAGELAINTADGKLFYKDSAGVVQVIGTKGGVGSSTTTQVLYNSSGLVVGSANMTFNGTTLTVANDASISGLTVGKGYGAQSGNVALGVSVLSSTSLTGNYNVGVGYEAVKSTTSGQFNVGVGLQSLRDNTTGSGNTAINYQALIVNTTGSSNTAIGQGALSANTTASNNTAVGYQAGYSNTTGSNLVFVGRLAGYANTGDNNTGVGSLSLYGNTSGSANSAFGYSSLTANTTGADNTAIGYTAMYSNTTGGQNVAIGRQALQANTTASKNTAVGYQSLYSYTTNGGNADNAALGFTAGYSSTTGVQNTFIGSQAGYYNTSSSYNTFTGFQAGYNSTGGSNCFYGYYAGNAVTTGSANSFLGYASGYLVTTGAKNTIVGAYNGNQGSLDIRTSSNYIVLSDGDGNPRIVNDNNGRTILNGTSPLNSSRLSIYETTGNSTVYLQNSNAAPYGMRITYSGASPNSNDNWFLYFEDTTNSKFTVVSSGTTQNRTGTYGTLSDVRLKQDIVDANSQWNDIKAIRFRKYRLIDDVNANSNAPYFMGVVAQELQETSPNLVEQYADKKGEMILSVKQSIIFMKAAKALQEAMERIETLEAKVTALENK